LDTPRIWDRIATGRYQDFDDRLDPTPFPQYYRRNFHYQTDGYLSDDSANLYDIQVEILFNGTADPMRRRVLAPLKQGLEAIATAKAGSRDGKNAPSTLGRMRVLDVACGTGRTLKMLQATLPDVSLFGLDLSPAYLRKANQTLQSSPTLPQLVQGQAEDMPYRDDYFDGLTSVFLFHELPGPVRQQVLEECFRVTRPGGILVICDSIQLPDIPAFEPMLLNFPELFHEPFYRDYIQDDLVQRLSHAGFQDITTTVHFFSKYWVARKPA
jgi:SAM-dependent methyltransferase